MNFRRTALTLAVSALVPGLASAQLVQTGRLEAQGGGLGSQLTLLTLQSPGSASAESGCVTPTGTTCTLNGMTFADVGVKTGSSQTGVALLSNSALSGLSGSNVRLIVNLAEPNSSPTTAMATLQDLRLVLYGSGGNILFQSMGFLSPMDLTSPGSGIGNFGFTFGLSGNDITLFNQFVGQATSLGVAASLTNAEGGIDAIQVARATTTVPEPSTYVLLSSGLLGVYGVSRRRRRSA